MNFICSVCFPIYSLATMYVNGTAVTRDALGVLSEVNNLQPYVFVGGHPTIQGRPRRAAALTSLVGCVRFLLLDGTVRSLGFVWESLLLLL